MYSNIMQALWIGCLFLPGWITAQPEAAPVIDANNISQLKPATVIDFGALPAEAGEIVNGRMLVDDDGARMAVVNRDGAVVFLDTAGGLIAVAPGPVTDDGLAATFMVGAFDTTGDQFAAVRTGGGAYYVNLYLLDEDGGHRDLRIRSGDSPVDIWFADAAVWLEVVPLEPGRESYLVEIPLEDFVPGEKVDIDPADLMVHAFAPMTDKDVVARIGRLPAPLTVTSTAEGVVSRWDLTEGVRTATAIVSDVPIYGAMTPDGRYLAWRDPASRALHLLDFETGQDEVVVALNGQYMPFILIGAQADVILGVHLNDHPQVTAWETQTGLQHELGPYRQCQRPPDMVTLTNSGRMLVIGCDTGLEIWQIVHDES